MQAVSLYDTITIEPSDTLSLTSALNIPVEDNLVYKAAQAFFSHTNLCIGAAITLKKEIPSQAGLGGGSSDAAHTLIGLNKLFDNILSINDLLSIGAKLGSDVPFFIVVGSDAASGFETGNFAIVEGRGERVIPVNVNSSLNLLLIHPPFQISTAWAYGQFRGRQFNAIASRTALSSGLLSALESYDFRGIGAYMRNDIEDVLTEKYPQIHVIKEMLMASGARAAMLSGSGSAVFGVFEDERIRDNAYRTLKANHPEYTIKQASTI